MNRLDAAALAVGAAGVAAECIALRFGARAWGSGSFAVSAALSGFMAAMAAGGWWLGALGRRRGAAAVFLGSSLAASLCLVSAVPAFLWAGPAFGLLSLLAAAAALGGALPLLGLLGPQSLGRLCALVSAGGVLGAVLARVVPLLGVQAVLVVSGFALAAAAIAVRPLREPASGRDGATAPWAELSGFGVFLCCWAGAVMMGAEAVWVRLLSLVFGSTTGAFATVLAVFLAALAAGAALGPRLLSRLRPVPALGWVLLAAGVSGVLALALFPFLPDAALGSWKLSSGHPALLGLLQAGLAAAVIGPLAVALGAAFPLAAAAGGPRLAPLYAASTAAGAVAPWIVTYVLIPWLGLSGTARALAGACLAAGAAGAASDGHTGRRRAAGFGVCAAALACVLAPGLTPEVVHSGVAVYPAELASSEEEAVGWRARQGAKLVFAEDGKEASVAVWASPAERSLVINGKTDASDAGDILTQRLLGHLPAVAAPRADGRALVIGLGSGVTAAAVALHGYSQVDVAEVEPAVARAARQFERANHDVLRNPRVRLHLGDGRRFLERSEGGYALITSEPSNPWLSGMSGLFSSEFFGLVRERLADDGILCQWLPAYGMTPRALAVAVATVRESFPELSLWGVGGDLLLLASRRPLALDLDAIAVRMRAPGVREELAGLGLREPTDLMALRYLGPEGTARLVGESAYGRHSDLRPSLEARAVEGLYDAEAQARNFRTLERLSEPLSAACSSGTDVAARLTRSLLAAARPDAARRELAGVAAGDPWRDGLERDLGTLYVMSGRPDAAVEVFGSRLKRLKGVGRARLDLAYALLEARRDAEALDQLDAFSHGGALAAEVSAARRASGRGPAFLALSHAFGAAGDGTGAARAFRGAVREDPAMWGGGAPPR